jgi:hypothetical protein
MNDRLALLYSRNDRPNSLPRGRYAVCAAKGGLSEKLPNLVEKRQKKGRMRRLSMLFSSFCADFSDFFVFCPADVLSNGEVA